MQKKKPKRITLKDLADGIVGINQKLMAMDQRITAMDQSIDSLNQRLSILEASQRRTGVLLEDIEVKLKLTLDGYKAFDKKIEEMEARMEEGFSENRYMFDVVFKKLDDIDATLAQKMDKAAV